MKFVYCENDLFEICEAKISNYVYHRFKIIHEQLQSFKKRVLDNNETPYVTKPITVKLFYAFYEKEDWDVTIDYKGVYLRIPSWVTYKQVGNILQFPKVYFEDSILFHIKNNKDGYEKFIDYIEKRHKINLVELANEQKTD